MFANVNRGEGPVRLIARSGLPPSASDGGAEAAHPHRILLVIEAVPSASRVLFGPQPQTPYPRPLMANVVSSRTLSLLDVGQRTNFIRAGRQ